MSKVTLMYPCLRNYGGFNTLRKGGSHGMADRLFVNHGLASISAVLKDRGHDVSLIDLRECKNWRDVYRRMARSNPDLFGVYMQTLDFHEAKRCGVLAQKLGIRSIVGGPHPSIVPDHVSENTPFDYIFMGEAERTLPEFVEDPGAFGKVIRGALPDINALPFEDRELFNMDVILKLEHPFYPTPFINALAGRGCPLNCAFCKPGEDLIFGAKGEKDEDLTGMTRREAITGFRARNVEGFVDELEMCADRYDYKMLWIDDDTLTVKPDYVTEFIEEYSNRVNRPWVCQSRADFIALHPDIVKRMKEAGLYMMITGYESGSQRVLNFLRKGTTVEQNLEAARVCKKYGIKIWANYMLGMPTETKAEVMETIEMLKTIKPDHYSPSFFTPIVGTSLYDYCKENNLIASDNPVSLGTRSPDKVRRRLKGVDYRFLKKVMLADPRVLAFSFPVGRRKKATISIESTTEPWKK